MDHSFTICFLASQTPNLVVSCFLLFCKTSGASSTEPTEATGKLYILLPSYSRCFLFVLFCFLNQLAKVPKSLESKVTRTHFYNCSSQFFSYTAFVVWYKNGYKYDHFCFFWDHILPVFLYLHKSVNQNVMLYIKFL